MRGTGRILLTLLRAFIRSKAALAGAVLFVLLFPVLLISILFDLQGGIENPYFSLLLYLVLGPLLILAIGLIVTGLLAVRTREDTGRYDYEFLKAQFTSPERFRRIRRHVYVATFSVSSFLFLLGVFAQTGNRYTDSVEFCGTFCHTVMTPAFVTYQNSPHSRVSCVACHIGKEVGALTGKLTGLKQLYATMGDTYPRPLQTPLKNLRPSRETCEECHRPEKFHGQKLYFVDTFLPDERNSHLQTVLIMKIGSGGYQGHSAHGIHWHTSEKDKLFYVAADQARQEIRQVTLIDSQGNRTLYFKNSDREPAAGSPGQLMDCMDCHNRPTHIFLSPEEALDQKLLAGQIPTGLPFIKREALAAITVKFESVEAAMAGIAARLQQWYGANYPELAASRPVLLAEAVRGAQQAYVENVFPAMNIGWETYPNFTGHRHGSGCFRCHDGSFRSAGGKTISQDCTLCHIILAENKPVEQVLPMIREKCS